MSHLIQTLEPRTLLTATSTSLAAELSAINTSGAAVKADLKSLTSGAKADLSALSKALKGAASSTTALFKTLQRDETKYLARITTDVNGFAAATIASKRYVADGNAVIKAPSNTSLTPKITADTTAALNVATKPQTKLQTDSATTTLDADFAALAAASSTVSSQVAADKSDLHTLVNKLLADANTFTNAVATLRTDLVTLLPHPTTTPSLVGDYKGTFKTKGVAFGLGSLTVPFEILITSQSANTLQGSITAEGQTASGTITYTELSNGKVSFQITDSATTVKLSGLVNVTTTKAGLPPGAAMIGSGSVSIAGINISGSFIVRKVS